MARAIVLNLQTPKAKNVSMFFAPIGMYINNKLLDAKEDTLLDFNDGWRKERKVLVRKCKIAVNSSLFDFLFKSIYGKDVNLEQFFERWEADCIVNGLGKGAFSRDEVLLLEVRDYDKDGYEIERSRKLQERELRRKMTEQKKMLSNARKGIFNHKDII